MPCQVLTVKGAVFVLWGKPLIEDLDSVLAALREAGAKCGHPVVYITRIPAGAPPPDAAARAHLDQMMPQVSETCSSYHVVLEGEGFGAAVKRGILLGLFQLGWRRKTYFVHATVDEVARNVSADIQSAVGAVVELARSRGMLVGPLKAGANAGSLRA